MITHFRDGKTTWTLIPPGRGVFPDSTTYTIIVGKNGTGKSRLLRNLVLAATKGIISQYSWSHSESSGGGPFGLVSDRAAEKILCVSTSPFDKFPLLKTGVYDSSYSYLGLRGLPSQNLGTAYMARIVAELIMAVAHDPRRSNVLLQVMQYMGYDAQITCEFVPSIMPRTRSELLEADDFQKAIQEFLRPPLVSSHDGGFSRKQIAQADVNELRNGVKLLDEKFSRSTRSVQLSIMPGDLVTSGENSEEITHLMYSGLLRLRSVNVSKAGHRLRLSDASSGEQAVMLSVLAIAGQIDDDTLVCIDEPEICLHPEWQEKYVHLLMDAFSSFKRCQFILATHSPQIVAELPIGNCFILDMQSGDCIPASNFSHRSIDYQLAHVFHTPGRTNEYLLKIALGLFSRHERGLPARDDDAQSFDLLVSLRDRIRPEDPLSDLISAVIAQRTNG